MNGLITPLFLLIASAGLFFGYVDGQLALFREKRAELSQYQLALEKATELDYRKQKLQEDILQISEADRTRLAKMLPSTVDSVRLIIELDGIAARYGLSLKNVVVGKVETKQALGSTNPFGVVTVSFDVASGYSTFLNFLRDLERNQRIADVERLAVKTDEKSNIYNYSVTLKTYWLK